MKILISLGHPAHFHLFKNFILEILSKGNQVKIVISEKDILKKLLIEQNIDYEIIAPANSRENLWKKARKIIASTLLLNKIVKEFKPDFLMGSLTQNAFVGFWQSIPSFFFAEDDINYTLLQCSITYPFIHKIISPAPTNVGFFKYKKISYNGYQKLAYLHPKIFKKNKNLIPEIDVTKPYFIIRLVNLKAYHDINIGGISEYVLDKILDKLKKKGEVYISSESQLSEKYENYLLPININYIHHALAYAQLYIGDSQSMAVESAILGTPSIRFNDFAGKISVLEELEYKYQLTFGIKSNDLEKLLLKIDELLKMENICDEFQSRSKKMLSEKINVTDFMVWFIENYPLSQTIMKETPDYQYNFR